MNAIPEGDHKAWLQDKGKYLPALLLFVATFVVYADVYSHTFLKLWDDQEYVLFNDAAQGFSLLHLKSAFSQYFIGNYAPMQIVSYMLDYSLWGMNPAGYLFNNILLHASSGLLLYGIMLRLGYQPLLAGMAAYIFLFHPVQVESVAWISQRKNLLAMFFFLFAWRYYVAYCNGAVQRTGWYTLSLASFAAALLSKSIAVILPPVLMVYDVAFRSGKDRRGRIADKIPYGVAAGAVAVLALVSQTETMGGGRGEYPGGSILSTCYTMTPVLASYLGDCLLPIDLLPYYRVAIRMHPDTGFFLSLALLATLIGLGALLFRGNRRLCFFYCLFFIALIPVSQVIPLITLKQDRYLYFPLLGLAGFSAEITATLIRRFPGRHTLISLLVLIALLPLPVLSWKQVTIWKDDRTLWSYTVRTDPESQFGWLQLSRVCTLEGNFQGALDAARRYQQLTWKYGSLP